MSKKDTGNPFLNAYNTADANLTSLMSEIKMLTTDPKSKMTKETYMYKVDQLTFKYANKLEFIGPGGQPTRDLNAMVQHLEKEKAENANVLGSRYQKRGTTSLAEKLLIGGGFSGAAGVGPLMINDRLKTLPEYSATSQGTDYKLNPNYVDSFNPKGETSFNDKSDGTDAFGRDYDHPNFGINPNRLNLSIKDGE